MNDMETARKFRIRRRQLVEAVEKTPAHEIDMCEWAGCAVGSFCKAHPRAELKLDVDECVVLDDLDGLDACAEFFGIDYEDADELLMPISYRDPTRRNVLARLKKAFVADLAAKA